VRPWLPLPLVGPWRSFPPFVFAVSVLAGTLFPVLASRVVTAPHATRGHTPAPQLKPPGRFGVFPPPSGSPEYAADFTTAGLNHTGELKHNRTDGRVRLPSSCTCHAVRPEMLATRRAEDPDRHHAEYGDWETVQALAQRRRQQEGYPPKANHTPSPHILSLHGNNQENRVCMPRHTRPRFVTGSCAAPPEGSTRGKHGVARPRQGPGSGQPGWLPGAFRCRPRRLAPGGVYRRCAFTRFPGEPVNLTSQGVLRGALKRGFEHNAQEIKLRPLWR